jgi:hypothetical protein
MDCAIFRGNDNHTNASGLEKEALMAAYTETLPWTSSLIRPAYDLGESDTTAFTDPDVVRLNADASTQPPWLEPVRRAITALVRLPQNWDGYGAAPLDEQLVQDALRMLLGLMEYDTPAPSVVPLGDGGIQFEWHRHGKNLEIEFPAGGSPSFYYYEDDSDRESEGLVEGDYDELRAYISHLR